LKGLVFERGLQMKKPGILAALCLGTSAGFAMADGDVVEGEKVFERCVSCHSLTENINQYGPNLKGVFGRPVASAEGFVYSNAMKAFAATGAVWDEATLDVFLKSPFNFVKGNNMRLVPPVKKDAERKNQNAFLTALR
jgi:cytochrome c